MTANNKRNVYNKDEVIRKFNDSSATQLEFIAAKISMYSI